MGFDFGGTFPPFSVTISDWVRSNDFDPFNAHRSGTLLLVDIYLSLWFWVRLGYQKLDGLPSCGSVVFFHIHYPFARYLGKI